jgi:hypothetical protein
MLSPENAPRLKLFLILTKAWENLHTELCKSQPKSISRKASDLLRNLPHWLDHVGQMFISANPIDLTEEQNLCHELLALAESVTSVLEVHITHGVAQVGLAEEKWGVLYRTVCGALVRMGAEFDQSIQSMLATVSVEPLGKPGQTASSGVQ